ncbi:hypothetical protein A0H76_3052 [Hepatospora eriocheir]|uniref:Uncharacterized protein n=1 Tax=Hepatospora eriocheir TaxID=1081669 RepID=A0A1X0QEJ7_9MICR|nr:hypothetical protein A0H76_3052 [Hepatospora eriocheir]
MALLCLSLRFLAATNLPTSTYNMGLKFFIKIFIKLTSFNQILNQFYKNDFYQIFYNNFINEQIKLYIIRYSRI